MVANLSLYQRGGSSSAEKPEYRTHRSSFTSPEKAAECQVTRSNLPRWETSSLLAEMNYLPTEIYAQPSLTQIRVILRPERPVTWPAAEQWLVKEVFEPFRRIRGKSLS